MIYSEVIDLDSWLIEKFNLCWWWSFFHLTNWSVIINNKGLNNKSWFTWNCQFLQLNNDNLDDNNPVVFVTKNIKSLSQSIFIPLTFPLKSPLTRRTKEKFIFPEKSSTLLLFMVIVLSLSLYSLRFRRKNNFRRLRDWTFQFVDVILCICV